MSRPSIPRLSRLLERGDLPLAVVDTDGRVILLSNRLKSLLPGEDQHWQGLTSNDVQAFDGVDWFAELIRLPEEISLGSPSILSRATPSGNRPAIYLCFNEDRQTGGGAFVVALLEEDAQWLDVRSVDAAASREKIRKEVAELARRKVGLPLQLVGESDVAKKLRKQVELARQVKFGTLLVGDSHAQLEAVARYIHASFTHPGSLVPLDCQLLDAELAQGTFAALLAAERETDAAVPTFMLLGLEHLPQDAQQELNGLLDLTVDMRIIATSAVGEASGKASDPSHTPNKILPSLAAKLSALEIVFPPLKARKEDLGSMLQIALEAAAIQGEKRLGLKFSEQAISALAHYHWPGDLDELCRCVSLCANQTTSQTNTSQISVETVQQVMRQEFDAARYPQATTDEGPIQLDELLDAIEAEMVQRALSLAKGNKTKAAELLGVTRQRIIRRVADSESDTGG